VSAPVVCTLLLAVLVGVLLALMGCSGVGEMEYRAAGVYYWEKKGQQTGKLIHEYCFQAADREKKAFLWGTETAGGRVKISIECGL
jgi:hypothetical protein